LTGGFSPGLQCHHPQFSWFVINIPLELACWLQEVGHHLAGCDEAATAPLDFLKDGAGLQGVHVLDGIAEKCTR
jgi:hypothetical protein